MRLRGTFPLLLLLLLCCEGEPGSAPQPFSVLVPLDDATAVLVSTTFEWKPSVRALTYTIVAATDVDLTAVLFTQADLTTTTYLPLAPLPTSTTVYWQVTAFNEKGSVVSIGAPSNFNTEGVPGPFTLTAPADTATGEPLLTVFSWTASAVADDYRLEVDDDPGFGSLTVDMPGLTGTTTTLTTPLAAATVYYWRVTSSNTFGTVTSAVFSFTTQ